ncbi:hypothetical protein M0R04_04720 [Candidatus Dojkabacteria bacterium]|jgi:hypothetical protein|nr:hypothetical protein [Candidatus Dojkabacteria bacterium]
MRTRDKRTHNKFVGQNITWVNLNFNNGNPVHARVVGCDYFVGISIVNARYPKERLTCIHGPLSPKNREKLKDPELLKQYERKFQYFLDIMRTNKVYDVDLKNDFTGIEKAPSGRINTCAFL